jgi:hypothetical protein
MHTQNKKLAELGQSTIEFIVVFCFAVSIIFMVFNSALNYCTGYLVHYATFMASRDYLTADHYAGTVNDPESSMTQTADKAYDTYSKYMLNAFGVGVDKFSVNQLLPSTDTSQYLTVGAKTIFEVRMDAIGRILGESKLELVSESFLGHEPTRAQCANRTCVGITGTTSCSETMDITLYDDGC